MPPYNFPRPFRVDVIDGVEEDDSVEALAKKFLDQLPTMFFAYFMDKQAYPTLIRISPNLFRYLSSLKGWDGLLEVGTHGMVVQMNYKLDDLMVWMTHVVEPE